MGKKNVRCCALCLGPTFKQVLSGPRLCIRDGKKVHKMLKLVSLVTLFHISFGSNEYVHEG